MIASESIVIELSYQTGGDSWLLSHCRNDPKTAQVREGYFRVRSRVLRRLCLHEVHRHRSTHGRAVTRPLLFVPPLVRQQTAIHAVEALP